MRKSKSVLAFVLTLTLILTSAISAAPVFAAVITKTDSAICKDLGMLKGTGEGVTADYLGTQVDRLQGAIMFLRLKGLEDDAKAFSGTDNFSDVGALNQTNKAILGYLKANPDLGFVGVGDNKFSPTENMTAKQYYKVLLTALGYNEGSDFDWANVMTFSASKGLTKLFSNTKFTVNDLSIGTVEGLKSTVKDSSDTLIAKLVDSGTISKSKATLTGLLVAAGGRVSGGSGSGGSAVGISAIADISGAPQVGVELTAGALTPAGATANYQWQICDTVDGTFTNIDGATTNKYTPIGDDSGKFIKVSATGTGSYTGTVTSAPTSAVEAAPTAVAFSNLTANGTSGTVTTTELTLTFDVDPTSLGESDITITGATKGALTGSGTTRTLAISGITVANDASITVSIANPTGFTIAPSSKTVAVNVAPTAPALIDDEMHLYQNVTDEENIVFTLDQALDLVDGAVVTGFSTSTGTIQSAVYDAETQTITLTSLTDGQWTSLVTVSYNQETGNVVSTTGLELGTITDHMVISH